MLQAWFQYAQTKTLGVSPSTLTRAEPLQCMSQNTMLKRKTFKKKARWVAERKGVRSEKANKKMHSALYIIMRASSIAFQLARSSDGVEFPLCPFFLTSARTSFGISAYCDK